MKKKFFFNFLFFLVIGSIIFFVILYFFAENFFQKEQEQNLKEEIQKKEKQKIDPIIIDGRELAPDERMDITHLEEDMGNFGTVGNFHSYDRVEIDGSGQKYYIYEGNEWGRLPSGNLLIDSYTQTDGSEISVELNEQTGQKNFIYGPPEEAGKGEFGEKE